jgi:hypothetical protein
LVLTPDNDQRFCPKPPKTKAATERAQSGALAASNMGRSWMRNFAHHLSFHDWSVTGQTCRAGGRDA